MGLLDFFSSPVTGDTKKRAQEALIYFHNAALHYNDYPYSGNYTEFIAYLDSLDGSFRDRLGKVLLDTNLSNGTIKESYEQLAASAHGNVPKTAGDLVPFFQSLADSEGNWDISRWVGVVKDATVESAKEVAVVVGAGLGLYALIGVGLFVFVLASKK